MQFRYIVQLAAVARAVSAAPADSQPRALDFDDIVVLYSDGSSDVVKEYEYAGLAARGIVPSLEAPRDVDPPKTNTGRDEDRSAAARGPQRRCEESTEIQITSDTKFLNWDVPMSPVVSGAGGSASVSVSSGYSISNSLTVGTSVSSSLEGFFSTTLSVDYSESWDSSQTTQLTYNVLEGEYGLVVSQPNVRRVQGNVLSGCTDSPTTQSFMSDSYTSQSYENLNWVTGIIRLCNSTEYPVPYCIGTGSHY
ncbi:hypothetical protein BX600DRAFT_438765 [Xylariales sp. PMI_506]|nr:hypothetical protein BX600DRAFT_438765 [Xylariales sp. PMI_506]